MRLTAAAVRPHVRAATALVVASAVTYPHGVIDGIEGIASLCKQRKV